VAKFAFFYGIVILEHVLIFFLVRLENFGAPAFVLALGKLTSMMSAQVVIKFAS